VERKKKEGAFCMEGKGGKKEESPHIGAEKIFADSRKRAKEKGGVKR